MYCLLFLKLRNHYSVAVILYKKSVLIFYFILTIINSPSQALNHPTTTFCTYFIFKISVESPVVLCPGAPYSNTD